ncbi:MAG: GNAT family N-acetyltransferase [Candidatus Sumerlaeota bacterium]|nr:GNAT family N-acetyltransferase [Candidatus Sumerlaeota bacterium]
MGIRIEPIKKSSPHLADVIRLADSNSTTLGFMPNGAFQEHAEKRRILLALDESSTLLGYLLFRVSTAETTIVHLCVDSRFRGTGIARALVKRLKTLSKDSPGIGLKCRRDYEASRMWPKFGFVAREDTPGRAAEGSELTKWWFDHGHPTLFSYAAEENLEQKTAVIVDSCVFFAHQDPTDEGHKESNALWADWLRDEIAVHVTSEVYNDIDRQDDLGKRDQNKKTASDWVHPASDRGFEPFFERMKEIFPSMSSEQDLSDLRHLARTLALSIKFFITRDGSLLKLQDRLEDEFGLHVLTPSDFVTHLDELRREDEYEPVRIAGTYTIQRQRVRSGQERELARHFLCSEEGEPLSRFSSRYREILQKPSERACYVYVRNDDQPAALMGLDRSRREEIAIPLLRVSAPPFAPTLIRHLLSKAILDATAEGARFLLVKEAYRGPLIASAAVEAGFIRAGEHWVKLLAGDSCKSALLADRLKAFAERHPEYGNPYDEVRRMLGLAIETGRSESFSELEHALWPTKILDAPIQTCIVPIEPEWAEGLFDENLARQTIFGAQDEQLAMNRENVYYRYPGNPRDFPVPARILWYVKGTSRYTGCKRIRACSRLNEVIVDDAKQVFRRFQRLGIYQWDNVRAIAQKNARGQVMAMRFDDTELLRNPLDLDVAKQIIEECQIPFNNFQSPLKVSSECFEKLYRQCH